MAISHGRSSLDPVSGFEPMSLIFFRDSEITAPVTAFATLTGSARSIRDNLKRAVLIPWADA